MDAAEQSGTLRDEALRLIEQAGLAALLNSRFGRNALVGSAALDLMTWRDIDIYVPVPRAEKQPFVDLLSDIHTAIAAAGLTLIKATFNDEWAWPRGDYGSGYYWGLRVATKDDAIWKIDLWGWEPNTFQRKLQDHNRLADALSSADRELILRLKTAAQTLPEFRSEITSWDIYRFVLDGRGGSLEELRAFCRAGFDNRNA